MVRKLKIGDLRITFVLRHRWEKDKSITNYEVFNMRKEFELGIWFKKNRAIGLVVKDKDHKSKIDKTFSKSNLVNSYMLGLNLIVCKCWINWTLKPTLSMEINE